MDDEREKLATVLLQLQDVTSGQAERAPTLEELADEVRVLRRDYLQIRVECQRLASLMESMKDRLDRRSGRRPTDKDWPV